MSEDLDPLQGLEQELGAAVGGTNGVQGRELYGDRWDVLIRQHDDTVAGNLAVGASRAFLRYAAGVGIILLVVFGAVIGLGWSIWAWAG